MTATGYVDACGFIPTAGGTTDFVVSAAVTGYQTPASAGAVNATVYSYRAESADKTQWEDGYGAYTVASTTLARTTVTASSTGAKVNFSAAPNVFVTALSADLENASLLTSGTVADARLSSNVPLKNAANTFTAAQTISGAALTVAGGDITTHRGTGAGAIYLGNGGGSYLYFDGSSYFTGGSGNLQIGTGASAVVAKNSAKAWVDFVGSTGAVNSSYNVSSVTRNSTGNYTLNFTASVGSTNYAVVGITNANSATNVQTVVNLYATSAAGAGINKTTTACQVLVGNASAGTVADMGDTSVIVFGT
jgi:hypothetical protein